MKSNLLKLTLVAAACAAISVPAYSQDDKTMIRITHAAANDIGTDQQMLAWTFANYVNDNSNTLEVKIFPNNQLGETREVLEAMQLGSGSSLHIGGMAEFSNFCKKCGITGLPFIWKDYAHINRVLDGEVGDALKKELGKSGFVALGYGASWGYRNVVTTSKTVNEVADLENLKIRTIPTPIFLAAINSMGASATPMNFGEIYTALETGVLDGFEHTAATVITNKFYEITKNIALTRHLYDPTVMAFSKSEWSKLDDKEKQVITDGARIATDVVKALAPVREKESIDFLRTKGMTVTNIDMSPVQKSVYSVQQELADKIGSKDLLNKILEDK